MKEKIFSALKTKFSNLGFSAKAIEGVAESLAATGLVNDENFDTIVEGQKSALSAMQAEIDRRVTSAVEEARANSYATTGNGGSQSNRNEPEEPFDAETFKAEILKTLREEQAAAAQQNQQAAQRAAAIASKAKEYGIPEKFAAKLNITQDADLDEYFKSTRQELADAGFEFSEPPAQGGGMTDNGSDIAKLIEQGTEQIVKSKKP